MIMELFKSSRLIAVNNILFQTDFNGRKTGSVQSLQFLKKVLKFAQQFSRPGKILENRDKVWKNGKKKIV